MCNQVSFTLLYPRPFKVRAVIWMSSGCHLASFGAIWIASACHLDAIWYHLVPSGCHLGAICMPSGVDAAQNLVGAAQNLIGAGQNLVGAAQDLVGAAQSFVGAAQCLVGAIQIVSLTACFQLCTAPNGAPDRLSAEKCSKPYVSYKEY